MKLEVVNQAQKTEDLPWFDFRDFHSGAFYYISAQKQSDDDSCEVRVTIFRANLTLAQLRELPANFNEAISFIILNAGARTVKTSTANSAYGIAEADWTGEDNE